MWPSIRIKHPTHLYTPLHTSTHLDTPRHTSTHLDTPLHTSTDDRGERVELVTGKSRGYVTKVTKVTKVVVVFSNLLYPSRHGRGGGGGLY